MELTRLEQMGIHAIFELNYLREINNQLKCDAIDDYAKNGGYELLQKCVAFKSRIVKILQAFDQRKKCVLVKSPLLPSLAQ